MTGTGVPSKRIALFPLVTVASRTAAARRFHLIYLNILTLVMLTRDLFFLSIGDHGFGVSDRPWALGFVSLFFCSHVMTSHA